ncbi:MAG: PHP domain-containing protein [Anaerolineales bacterium]|nr:PHP domain-containing protein [Anaerolineales bacterium]
MNTLSLPQLARSSSERADLHLHSHYSDGQYAPRVLAQMAAQKGLRVIALTDHATTRGIAEMIAEASRWGIYNLPAIELNAQTGDFLGYYIDYEHQGLLAFLQEMNALREKRIRLTVARLREFGYDLAWSALVEFSKPALPSRAHIARMLVALKRFPNVDLVFKTLLGRRQPAYIEPEAPPDEQCVRIIREAGGLAVLAHPQFLNVDPENLQPYIQQLVAWGVSGVEQMPERVRGPESAVWEQARKEHGLFEIQGSGFHGEEISNVCLGDKTIGADFFSVMEASLPPQSAHKSFFKRLYWRSSNLSPAEFHQSLFPEDYHVITPHHTDLLDYQPEIPPVPADYVGLPFVLVTPGALDQIDEIRKILGAFGAQIVA